MVKAAWPRRSSIEAIVDTQRPSLVPARGKLRVLDMVNVPVPRRTNVLVRVAGREATAPNARVQWASLGLATPVPRIRLIAI